MLRIRQNVEIVASNGARSHVEQRINEGEAAVVRRIFELAAKGLGQNRIAKQLNAEGVPAPRAQQGRPTGWIRPQFMPSCSESAIAESRADTYVRHSASRESKYLLPGLARCACGKTVCRNHLQFPMHGIDRAGLDAVDEILTPDIVDEVVAKVREELDPRNRTTERERLAQQIDSVDQQIENLADAIATVGGDVPALARRLSNAHQRRQELVSAMEAARTPTPLLRA